MSRVTYMSLIPQDDPDLSALMGPGETEPHLTLCLWNDNSNSFASRIGDAIGFWPGWADSEAAKEAIVGQVTSQSVYGRNARVLELDPAPFNPLRVELIEWLIDNDLKPQSRVGAWAPHVTLGRDLAPVEHFPRYLIFDQVRVKGMTYRSSFKLVKQHA